MNINNRQGQFKKTGEEFKKVLSVKISGLKSRLEKRNKTLDDVMNDKKRLRSYLLRSAKPANYGNQTRHGVTGLSSYGHDHIGIEEVEEIKNLCSRIFEIENEIRTYETLKNNLADEDKVELTLQELIKYGFE